MFLDTSFNSLCTVLSTIYQNFVEAAMKYYRYAKCMGGGKHPQLYLLIGEFALILINKAEISVGRELTTFVQFMQEPYKTWSNWRWFSSKASTNVRQSKAIHVW